MIPETLILRLSKTTHGFKPFEKEARALLDPDSLEGSRDIALELLTSGAYQVRCCGVFMLGLIAASDASVLHLLKEQARTDISWQVQEVIAKAFDQFCRDRGYGQSLPEIREWLADPNPNVCRAVTEGLRIWTGRPYFRDNPQAAIALISTNKSSESGYLRMSVGNSLRDIGKRYPELVEKEVSGWDMADRNVAFTYRYVLKRH